MAAVAPSIAHERDDPYNLDLLVSEVRSRPSSPSSPEVDLPAFLPLSHTHPHLDPSSHHLPFSVDEFLLTRSAHTSLPDLRTELRDYLAQLKEELVALINRDYGDFVSLGTDLRGEGERLERLGKPLNAMKEEVEMAKTELEVLRSEVREKLSDRASLREEKALLHLLVTLSDSLVRLESLLAIAAPDDPSADLTSVSPKLESQSAVTSSGAKHLSRVAAEYLQMLYHADKARAEGCAFVSSNQWRIDRIHSTLSRDLDTLFASLVSVAATPADVFNNMGGASASDRGRKMADLNECLRTYDALGEWRQAEEVLRKEVVRPFVRKIIHSSALTAPPSPLLPHTPYPRNFRGSISLNPFSPPPITPGLAPSANPYMAHAPLLLNEDTPLAALYNQLLRFAERELAGLVESAERISGGHRGRRMAATVLDGDSEVDGQPGEDRFEFLSNVVWAEVSATLMDEMGGQLFAAGRPDEFLTNFRTTSAFLVSLESLCPSLTSVLALRAHPSRRAFDRRWQLPVYYQLRWKEIVGALEESLSGQGTVKNMEGFSTPQASAVWQAVQQCWSDEIYVHELGERFWKLTLQIITRYRSYIEASMPVDVSGKVGALLTAEKTLSVPAISVPGSRAATPIPPSTPEGTGETILADENTLRQTAHAIRDLKLLEDRVWDLYDERIGMLLEEPDEAGESTNDTLRASLARLLSPIPGYTSQIIAILTKRCADPLRHVRSIASQYRAMTTKREPTEPSYFVPGILRPVKVFFDRGGPGEGLKDAYGTAWTAKVLDDIAQRYTSILIDMKKTEDSLRRFKQGKKTTFSLFGSSSAGKEEEGKDEDRVKKQMLLDVNALGKDAEALGVDVGASESFRTLKQTIGMDDAGQ